MTEPSAQRQWFATKAQKTAKAAGSSAAFLVICIITLGWLISGPIFHWSDTWQLVINTVPNIFSMFMVFLIQNTQHRESAAQQLKLDELLRALRGAQNAFINLNTSENRIRKQGSTPTGSNLVARLPERRTRTIEFLAKRVGKPEVNGPQLEARYISIRLASAVDLSFLNNPGRSGARLFARTSATSPKT